MDMIYVTIIAIDKWEGIIYLFIIKNELLL